MNSLHNQSAKPVLNGGETVGPGAADPDSRYERARRDMAEGLFTEAAYGALAVVTLCPRRWEAHCLAGVALLRLGLVDEAEQSLLETVELKPDCAEAHLALAHIYSRHRRDFFRLGRHRHLAARCRSSSRGEGWEFMAA